MKITTYLTAAALSLATSTLFGVTGAGVNFTDTGYGPALLLAGKTASGVDTWGDVNFNTKGTNQSTGVGGLTFGYSTAGAYWGGSEEFDMPEKGLFRCYADDNATGQSYADKDVGVYLTISGLDNWMTVNGFQSYTLKIFYSSDSSGAQFGNAWLTDLTGKSTAYGDLNDTTGLLHTWGVGEGLAESGDGSFPNGTGVTDGERAIREITGLTADSIGVINQAREGYSNDRTSIAGFAVIGVVPEPSTYALLGGLAAAGVALVARRRKRG